MSAPSTDDPNPVSGAALEIISAISALHMAPEPVQDMHENAFYLADTDKWAKHAVEHLNAALAYIRQIK